jgi:hypothetical protein
MVNDQLQESIFPGCADGTEAGDIDDKFAAIEMLFGLCVLAKEFGYRGPNETTLDHQPALAWAVNDRNLQHATPFRKGTRMQHTRQTLQLFTTLISERH